MSTPTVGQRNAAFDAVKAALISLINTEGGAFSGMIESRISDAEILVLSDAALTAVSGSQ
jgi:hypothetical protein